MSQANLKKMLLKIEFSWAWVKLRSEIQFPGDFLLVRFILNQSGNAIEIVIYS